MIYIQSEESGLPHHFDAACAMYGAKDLGIKYRLTTFEEIESGKFDALLPTNPCVGSVEFMNMVFKRMGIHGVRVPRNSNRIHKTMKLHEAKAIAKSGRKIFIKPFEIKLFTGFVLDTSIYSCIEGIDQDCEVMVYEPFESEIASEWRAYIHNNKIVDCRSYSGDMFLAPSEKYIEGVIGENKKDFPCSYTIDVGVLQSGENVVVEFNDMWAIGNYGVSNDDYLRMLRDRYFEITRNANSR